MAKKMQSTPLFKVQDSGLLLNNIPHKRNYMLGAVLNLRGGGVFTLVFE